MITPLGLCGASQCSVTSVSDGLSKVKDEIGPGARVDVGGANSQLI